MILIDTSVWIQHFRVPHARLVGLLEDGLALIHPYVLGELACGTLRRRQEILSLLGRLEVAPTAGHDEVLRLIEARRLMGRGLGWVDVHLLASCLIAGITLWTLDRRLDRVATQLGVAG